MPSDIHRFSTTTTGSKINLTESHALITRKDLRASIACFEELMAAAKAYRNALLAMSTATAAFASAMEACSRVKGCRGANAALAGGAGLQFLISNHEQLLADTVYRQFEIPLLEVLDNYKLLTADRLAQYEKALQQQSDKIRKTESENMKIGRRRKRDLAQFRDALSQLQRQVDELDGIKLGYHEEVLDAEEETWDTVLSKVAFVIRSQLDFYEKIAGKASDPVLEPLVMSIPDPFDSYGPPKEDGHIFSVLSPLHLDSIPTSPTPNLTRISQSGSTGSTPRASSPSKLPFSALGAPAKAETSVVDAMGESGAWNDESGDVSGAGGLSASVSGTRAQRSLSIIDEGASSHSPDKSPVVGKQPVGGDVPEEIADLDGDASDDDTPTVNNDVDGDHDHHDVRDGSDDDDDDHENRIDGSPPTNDSTLDTTSSSSPPDVLEAVSRVEIAA